MKSGLRSGKGFAIASMPKGAGYIRRIVGALRRDLETAIMAKFGEITFTNAALAQSTARHEARAQLAQRYLRLHSDTMNHGELLAYMKEISAATDRRDACLRQLGLDRSDRASILDVLYDQNPASATDACPETPATSPGFQEATNAADAGERSTLAQD